MLTKPWQFRKLALNFSKNMSSSPSSRGLLTDFDSSTPATLEKSLVDRLIDFSVKIEEVKVEECAPTPADSAQEQREERRRKNLEKVKEVIKRKEERSKELEQKESKNEQEATLRKKQEEEASLRLQQEEEARLRLQQEEEARLKLQQEEEARLKLQLEEEAKLKLQQEEEAKLRLQQEEEIKKKRLEEEKRIEREEQIKIQQEKEKTANSTSTNFFNEAHEEFLMKKAAEEKFNMLFEFMESNLHLLDKKEKIPSVENTIDIVSAIKPKTTKSVFNMKPEDVKMPTIIKAVESSKPSKLDLKKQGRALEMVQKFQNLQKSPIGLSFGMGRTKSILSNSNPTQNTVIRSPKLSSAEENQRLDRESKTLLSKAIEPKRNYDIPVQIDQQPPSPAKENTLSLLERKKQELEKLIAVERAKQTASVLLKPLAPHMPPPSQHPSTQPPHYAPSFPHSRAVPSSKRNSFGVFASGNFSQPGLSSFLYHPSHPSHVSHNVGPCYLPRALQGHQIENRDPNLSYQIQQIIANNARPSKRPPLTREGDWVCPNRLCANLNWAKRNNCNLCGQDKRQQEKQPRTAQNPENNTLRKICRKCGAGMGREALFCGFCGEAR